MSISLNVYYKPNCRIRNEETIDGGLNLRCDVDAFPPNVTYTWTHNDRPIPASDGPTLYYRYVRYTFSSNHNIHKISCGLCFWTLDPFINRLYSNLSIKGFGALKQRPSKLL